MMAEDHTSPANGVEALVRAVPERVRIIATSDQEEQGVPEAAGQVAREQTAHSVIEFAT